MCTYKEKIFSSSFDQIPYVNLLLFFAMHHARSSVFFACSSGQQRWEEKKEEEELVAECAIVSHSRVIRGRKNVLRT